jgi:hypothetical protein
MYNTYGSIYNFAPQTFILPREEKLFRAECEKPENKVNIS